MDNISKPRSDGRCPYCAANNYADGEIPHRRGQILKKCTACDQWSVAKNGTQHPMKGNTHYPLGAPTPAPKPVIVLEPAPKKKSTKKKTDGKSSAAKSKSKKVESQDKDTEKDD